jgi:hypothetical protein
MDVDEAFGKVLGRQPSETERERLYRVRDTLGLRDNDAFWYIVMILEHYDALYRDYPRQLAEQTSGTIVAAREAFAAAAAAESAKAQTMLAQKVAETSVTIARKLAERPVGIHRVTAILAAVVAFGGLCVTAGYKLGSPERPFWCRPAGPSEGIAQVIAVVLGAPAGWMVFALLLPLAAHGAKSGWTLASDTDATWQRMLGWALLGGSVFGAGACAVALVKALG